MSIQSINPQSIAYARAYASSAYKLTSGQEVPTPTDSFAALIATPAPSAPSKPISKDSVTLSAQAQKTLEPAPKRMGEYADSEEWKKARVEDGTFEKYKDAGDKVELPSLTTAYVAKGYEDQYKIGKVDPAEVKEGFGNYFVYRMEFSIGMIMSNLQGWQSHTQRIDEIHQNPSDSPHEEQTLADSEAFAEQNFGRMAEAIDEITAWTQKNGVEEEASQFFAEYTEEYFGQKLDLQALQNITAQVV